MYECWGAPLPGHPYFQSLDTLVLRMCTGHNFKYAKNVGESPPFKMIYNRKGVKIRFKKGYTPNVQYSGIWPCLAICAENFDK